jgi:hypothetical protein
MDYYLGGYYLVEGVARPDWTASFLPDTLWTVSACICPTYPDSWGLPWVSESEETLQEIRERLGLEPEAFQELRREVDAALAEERFGWPNVWLDLASARAFRRRYLRHIPQLTLLAIALPEPYVEDFLRDETPIDSNEAEVGIFRRMLRRERWGLDGDPHGFDVLGAEMGGSLHTFVCNGLEKPYQDQLGIALNQHGLIDGYDDAIRAAEYTNLESTGAEPVAWYPWLVVEHPLDSEGTGLVRDVSF